MTENFRARVERLQFAQQRQSATKPQYEANIPSDTRRTLVSHLQKQKHILVRASVYSCIRVFVRARVRACLPRAPGRAGKPEPGGLVSYCRTN